MTQAGTHTEVLDILTVPVFLTFLQSLQHVYDIETCVNLQQLPIEPREHTDELAKMITKKVDY